MPVPFIIARVRYAIVSRIFRFNQWSRPRAGYGFDTIHRRVSCPQIEVAKYAKYTLKRPPATGRPTAKRDLSVAERT